MKIFKLLIFLILISNSIMAQMYIANDENSKISFVIKNLGINVNGTFKDLKGNIIFDSKNLKSSEINVSVSSKTVNTDNKTRDKHIKESDYFDVEKFPFVSFKSTKIESATRINRYLVEGELTIKNIVKQIKFELIALEKDNGIELKCNFEINRRNFKVGGNSLVLSDIVKMNLNIIGTKKAL